MAKKSKTVTRKGKSVPIPTTREEAAELLAKLGTLKRKIETTQSRLNAALQRAADKAEAEGGPLVSEFEATMVALERFADENQKELLTGETRSFSLANGSAGWRDHPAKVNIRGTDAVLENIKRLKLSKFIRTVEEINKEAMLADEETATSIDGVSISRGSTFYVQLAGSSKDLTASFKLKVPKVE